MSRSVFQVWVDEDVIKKRGANKGLKGKVIWAKKDPEDPNEDLIGVRYNHSDRVYACRPHNFALVSKKPTMSYTPRATSIQKAKAFVAEEHRAVVLKGKTYVPMLETSMNPAVRRYLIGAKVLRKAGRFGTVLKEHGSDWNEYKERRMARDADAAYLDPGVVTYELLKGVDEPW